MIYSKATEYALNALVYLAEQTPDSRKGVHQIAEALDIPGHFLGKILQDLRKEKIVESIRGRAGGFRLAQEPEDIGLYDVVSVLEDLKRYEMCIFDEFECTVDRPCSMVCEWNAVKNTITDFLQSHTLADLRMVRQFRSDLDIP